MCNHGSTNRGDRFASLMLAVMLALCAGAVVAADFPYEGTLRILVVEPISRWQDSYGIDFRYGFLDWATIAGVSLGDTSTWDTTVSWDADAAGYPDITQDNIMVIAALYNTDGELRDAFFPNGFYFLAFPVDATAAATPGSPGANQASEDCAHTVMIEAGVNNT